MTVPAALDTITGTHGPPVPDSLTRDDRKRVLFGADVWFRQGWADARRLLGEDAADTLHDTGLVLLKPDAVARRHLDTVLDWLAARGGTVLLAERVVLGRQAIRAMWQYQLNAASIDRLELADLALADRPSLLLLVRLPHDPVPASTRLSAGKGPSDPLRREPGQLRSALPGGNFLLSFVHAADEPADVVRELAILLDGRDREAALRSLGAGTPVDVAPVARAVEAEQPAHDLDLGTVLDHLAAAVPPGPQAGAFRARLDGVRAGEAVDWRELLRAADTAGVPADLWDRALVGTYLMRHTEPGVAPILSGVDPATWEEPA